MLSVALPGKEVIPRKKKKEKEIQSSISTNLQLCPWIWVGLSLIQASLLQSCICMLLLYRT